MKLSNFKVTGRGGVILSEVTFAEVDVTTGCWWWKKTERREIGSNGGYWFFTDTGEFTPGHQAETLERAWRARNTKKN